MEEGPTSKLATCSRELTLINVGSREIVASLFINVTDAMTGAMVSITGRTDVEFRPYRGTERASLTSATEGCLLLAAALETVLLAGLALNISHAGRGSVTIAAFLRLNEALVKPFALLPVASLTARLCAAVVVYGALCAALTGAVAWLDRRQDLRY